MTFQRIALRVFLLAVVATGPVFGATCTNANLNGVSGFFSDGFDSTGVPGTSVGQYKFDGDGNVSGAFTHSSNGAIQNVTFSGTYSVSKNCTGTLVLNNSKGVTEHHSFVIDDAKKGMQLISTDSLLRSGLALPWRREPLPVVSPARNRPSHST